MTTLYFEMRRKLFHLISLLFVPAVLIVSEEYWPWIGGGIIVFGVLLDRMRNKILFIGVFERQSEKSSASTVFWYGFGIGLPLILFPTEVFSLALPLFFLADGASAVIGKFEGKNKSRTFFGTSAGVLLGVLLSIVAILVFDYPYTIVFAPIIVSSIDHIFPSDKDNLWGPVVLSLLIYLFLII